LEKQSTHSIFVPKAAERQAFVKLSVFCHQRIE
jgi:hypothetical protein